MGYFTDKELQCPCCHEMRVTDAALAQLNKMREILGKPMVINSAYRCAKHNIAIGGAPASSHVMGKAFDVSLNGQNRFELLDAALKAGFKGIGYYNTWLHVDISRKRFWIDGKNKKETMKLWKLK